MSSPIAPFAAAGFNRLKDCRHGRMLYNINDVFVGRSFDLYGEFSQGEVDLFAQIVKPGNTVLDVGANIGAHTVVFAKLAAPGGTVLAFEPQRLVYQTLCANVALNNLTNVYCLQLAVGEAPGIVRVPSLNPRELNNFGGLELGGQCPGEDAPVIRLDSLALGRCDFIKIDVEGMERQALLGASGIIEKFRPALYVENDRPHESAALIRHIDAIGYQAHWHEPALFNPRNFLANPNNVFGPLISRNMFCVPKESQLKIANGRPIPVPPA